MDNYLTIYKTGGTVITGKESITLDKIIEGGGLNITNLVRNNEQPRLSAFILMALKEVWANTDNIFTNESIAGCTMLLINEYPYWLPKEVLLMLKNGMVGKYGKTFGKVSTATIMEWAQCYEVERIYYFEKKELSRKQLDWRDMNPDILRGAIGKDKEPEPKKSVENNDMFQKWIKEFDEICRQQGVENGVRFIEVEGQKMNVDQYLLHKLKQ